MEEKLVKKPVYEYHRVAPIFENNKNYNSNQIMEILNIKRTAYSQWWKKYEKDKKYTDNKIEKEFEDLKIQIKEKEDKLQFIEKALSDIHNIELDNLLDNYKK